jgi:phage shock protein C
MDQRDRATQDWVLLIVGIAIVLIGGSILINRVSWPFLEPIRIAIDFIQRISWPLVIVAGGVLLILYATRRDLFTRADGRRLYRSRTHRAIAGVLGGVAEYFGWDVALVRILYVVLAVLTGFGPLILAYIIAAIAIPEAPPSATVVPPAWPTAGGQAQPPTGSPAPPPQPYSPPPVPPAPTGAAPPPAGTQAPPPPPEGTWPGAPGPTEPSAPPEPTAPPSDDQPTSPTES